LGFDYIVIHETGHEWWGNSISTDDHAELWLHESFCTYGEAVYVEAMWGKKKATEYLLEQRTNILNLQPIIGPRDVNYNQWIGSDMYYKGAWMLHTLRNCVNDDLAWWDAIYKFATENKLKVMNTTQVIDWFNRKLGKNFTPVFRQYLYHAELPVLEYKVKKKKGGVEITCRWDAGEPGFSMPIEFTNNNGEILRAQPSKEWQTFILPGSIKGFRVDTDNYLVKIRMTE
jgi:aminopeptidase N